MTLFRNSSGVGEHCGLDFPDRICIMGTECLDGVCVAIKTVVDPGTGKFNGVYQIRDLYMKGMPIFRPEQQQAIFHLLWTELVQLSNESTTRDIIVRNTGFFKFPVYSYSMFTISSLDKQPTKNVIEQVDIMLMILSTI